MVENFNLPMTDNGDMERPVDAQGVTPDSVESETITLPSGYVVKRTGKGPGGGVEFVSKINHDQVVKRTVEGARVFNHDNPYDDVPLLPKIKDEKKREQILREAQISATQREIDSDNERPW